MPRRTTTPRPRLTRERVLRAALALADEQGIEALSMRRLGDAVGVKAMSLYNHVRDKDAILDGILELVVGEIELPAGDLSWKQALRLRTRSAHAMLLRHPWACSLITARPNLGPAMMGYLEWTFAVLLDAGFPPEAADHAANALDSHLYGFTLQHLNFPFDHDAIPEVVAEFLPAFDAEAYPSMVAVMRTAQEASYGGVNRLEFGLDLLLDGLERLLEASDPEQG